MAQKQATRGVRSLSEVCEWVRTGSGRWCSQVQPDAAPSTPKGASTPRANRHGVLVVLSWQKRRALAAARSVRSVADDNDKVTMR